MKLKPIVFALTLAFAGLTLSACDDGKVAQLTPEPEPAQVANAGPLMSLSIQKADKIEVIHFHATQQCYSCITVGKYALKTIQERFPEEYKNGIVAFREINVDLPENRDMVIKYQAGGSSLFVNAIADGRDQIEEDVKIWRLIGSEQTFMDYFEEKLKGLLG